MSYTVVNPGSRPRPATVTAASLLLYLAAVTQLVSIWLSFLALGPVRTILDEEFAGKPDADAVGTAVTVGIIVGIVVSAIFVVGTAVLGLLVGKGKNPARIVTWVLAGIGVLCYGCGLAGTAVSGAMTGSFGQANADSAEIQRRIEEATPAWQASASTILSIAMLLVLLVVIILLALPASNEFFRKEEQVWVPPTSMGDPGGYPPVPPAPPTP